MGNGTATNLSSHWHFPLNSRGVPLAKSEHDCILFLYPFALPQFLLHDGCCLKLIPLNGELNGYVQNKYETISMEFVPINILKVCRPYVCKLRRGCWDSFALNKQQEPDF